ncbi:MAG TPA: hypothetical protein VFK74_08865 [Azospira sp.]|nr:hypothetical protein [Azospira sp.]
MKKLLSLLFFKFRLALLAGLGRFVILPIVKALFRRLARQAETMRQAQTEPAYARAPSHNATPQQPVTIDGEWRRVNDRRQNW